MDPGSGGALCCKQPCGDASGGDADSCSQGVLVLGAERVGSLLWGWIPAPGIDPCPVNGL